MSSSHRKRPDPCSHENCGSRRFHVGDDGFTYCARGHQQSERGAVIAEDTGEFVAGLGRKSRRRSSAGESTISRVSAGFTTSEAFEQYLLCLQLVLRKQLRWLVAVQKFPEGLENIVRELWTLRLHKLQHKLSYASDSETGARSSQVFSSQSESESATASQSSRRGRRKDSQAQQGAPGIVDTLALSYIGLLLLRMPVTAADLHIRVNSGELLYYRIPREVPLGMRERLPGMYQELLEPQDLLQAQTLQDGILRNLGFFYSQYGMAVPPLNYPLLLHRWMRELALPVEVFAGTQRLMHLLEMDVTCAVDARARYPVPLRAPEIRLVALLVAATKIIFPFDSIKSYAHKETDLGATRLDWDQWKKVRESASPKVRQDNNDDQLSFEQAFEFDESDCLAASDTRLDCYLDWCAENVASEEMRTRGHGAKDAEFRRSLFQLFPLRKAQNSPNEHLTDEKGGKYEAEAAIDARLQQAQSCLVATPILERAATHDSKAINRPGSLYWRCRTADDLSGPSLLFFESAASLAATSLSGLVKAVSCIEGAVWKHERRLKRTEA